MVKRDMNAILERLMIALEDELKFAFDARFGTETKEWTEITLFKTMKKIVAQASSRFTVGLPMCKIPAPKSNLGRLMEANWYRPQRKVPR